MSKTKKIQNKNKNNGSGALLITLICVVALALVGVIVALVIVLQPKEMEIGEFVPPAFDSGATEGTPTVPEGMGYSELYRDGMTFKASVCGVVDIVDGKADIYFTNSAENTLWMKIRIFDESGKIIAESGLIKPNEYVKTVTFNTVPADGSKIRMKIMTYEPDTYYSGGAVSMTTVANVK